MKRMLPILIALAIALSGCASDEKPAEQEEEKGADIEPAPYTPTKGQPPAKQPPGSGPDPGEGEEPGTDPEQENRPPNVAIEATHGNAIPGTVVTYTIRATDPDGDALSWHFDFGGGEGNETGLQLPFTLSHNYTTQGTYRAVLSVSDGPYNVQAVHWLEIDPTLGPNAGLKSPRVWGGSTQVSNPSGVCVGQGVDGLHIEMLPDMSNWTYILYGNQNLPDPEVPFVPMDGWTVTFIGGDVSGIQGNEGVVPTNATTALVCNQTAGPLQNFMIVFYDEGWTHTPLEDPAEPCYYYC